jgi:AcrR family transcriptional regulator
MRVTQATRLATRSQILEAARALFSQAGFEQATTREIAARAGIAAGTLFNYFPTKEAIAVALVAEAMARAHRQFDKRPAGQSLEESLFALVAHELRYLKSCRPLLAPVLELALSPMVGCGASPEAESIRLGHLERAGRLITERFPEAMSSPLVVNLYWTLYTGVLAFWAVDDSPSQEDTLAVLDHYVKAFAGSLFGSC